MANADIGIGRIINQPRGRDAIHVAVAPMEAAHQLFPGQHVGVVGKGRAGLSDRPVGIVDPFLKAAVNPGEQFYLFLYPGSIESLRHEWVHPAFDEEVPPSVEAPKKASRRKAEDPLKDTSRAWIEDFADKLGLSYERMMEAAAAFAESGDYMNMGSNETYNDYYSEFETFWNHYEVVTGTKVESKHCFFSCAC